MWKYRLSHGANLERLKGCTAERICHLYPAFIDHLYFGVFKNYNQGIVASCIFLEPKHEIWACKVSLKLRCIFPSLTAHIKPGFCPVWCLGFPCTGPAALTGVMGVLLGPSKLTCLLWKPCVWFYFLRVADRLSLPPKYVPSVCVCEFNSPGKKFPLSAPHIKSDKEGSASSFFSGEAGFMTHRCYGI